MCKRIVILAAAVLTLASGAPSMSKPVPTLVPHTATYKVKISVASGTLTSTVAEEGDGFRVRSVIEPKGFAGLFFRGVIEENSRFVVSDDGVVPVAYWSNDELSSDPKRMDFDFDWAAREVTGTINEAPFSFPLDREAHDRVSIQYELMHNLVTGQPSEEYALLDGDELKEIVVTVIGRKEIKVPYGRFDAVGIQHQAANSKRVTTLWCAEELGYLPVLIEQSRNGDVKVRAMLADYDASAPVAVLATSTGE